MYKHGIAPYVFNRTFGAVGRLFALLFTLGRAVRGDLAYPLGRFLVSYLATAILFAVFIGMLPPAHQQALGIPAYLLSGIFLSRAILGRIQWHPFTGNQLDRIAAAKTVALLTWPIVYPILLLQLLAAKVL